MQQQLSPISLERDFFLVLNGKDEDLKRKASEFQEFTKKLIASHAGRRWFETLCAFAGHPMDHAPGRTEHEHGRCEVTSFLLRRATDTALPILSPEHETQTQTKQDNGKHKQRRKASP